VSRVVEIKQNAKTLSIGRAIGILLILFAGFILSVFLYAQIENVISDHFSANSEAKTKKLSDKCTTETGASTGTMWESCMFANAPKD
jgi:hypothetical protein